MVAKAIGQYLEDAGIKKVFLCEKTGLPPACVYRTLNGKRKMSFDEYEKICFALGVPVDFFFKQRRVIA